MMFVIFITGTIDWKVCFMIMTNEKLLLKLKFQNLIESVKLDSDIDQIMIDYRSLEACIASQVSAGCLLEPNVQRCRYAADNLVSNTVLPSDVRFLRLFLGINL